MSDDVAVAPDGTVFVAKSVEGLTAYSFDGSAFTRLANFGETRSVHGVTVSKDGMVFVAGYDDGLIILRFDDTVFTVLSRSRVSSMSQNVAVRSDGSLFLAGVYHGMLVYEFTGPLGIGGQNAAVPQQIHLTGNHPNPFRPSTSIDFELKQRTQISLIVTNALGKQVALLIDGETWEAGQHSVRFDPGELTPGAYFYSLIANGLPMTKKMLLLQ